MAALALCIIFGLIISIVGTVFLKVEMTQDRMRAVEMVLSGVLAIVSMYVGAKIQKKRDDDDKGL